MFTFSRWSANTFNPMLTTVSEACDEKLLNMRWDFSFNARYPHNFLEWRRKRIHVIWRDLTLLNVTLNGVISLHKTSASLLAVSGSVLQRDYIISIYYDSLSHYSFTVGRIDDIFLPRIETKLQQKHLGRHCSINLFQINVHRAGRRKYIHEYSRMFRLMERISTQFPDAQRSE